MTDRDQPSERLVEQRLRNRAIEALEALAAGDDGVRAMGTSEYLNLFFDTIDDEIPWQWREWSTFTPDEVAALDRVHRTLLDAIAATPQIRSIDEFIASGWPARIAPVAATALGLMQTRGRFSEEREEDSPSDMD
jgi:hypothetical protein